MINPSYGTQKKRKTQTHVRRKILHFKEFFFLTISNFVELFYEFCGTLF